MSVTFFPQARRDAIGIGRDLMAAAGRGVSARFEAKLRQTTRRLERFPQLAARSEWISNDYPELRVAQIEDFRNYLLFYEPSDDGIRVIRVVHGAMNIEDLFD